MCLVVWVVYLKNHMFSISNKTFMMATYKKMAIKKNKRKKRELCKQFSIPMHIYYVMTYVPSFDDGVKLPMVC